MRLWLTFIVSLLLTPLALGYTVFTARTASIRCARDGSQISCSNTEHIGPYQAWSKTVTDISLVRDMSQSDNGSGVVAETETGDDIQLTSSFLDDNTQAEIDNRIHQFIYAQTKPSALDFDMPPTLLGLAPGAGVTLLFGIGALISLVRIIRTLFSGRRF
jgi:hypothetical protein